jgi:hypothetical protein
LVLSAPENHDYRAVDYTVQGKAGNTPFTAISHVELVESPPYGIYKNMIVQEVEVQGVSDSKLSSDIQLSLNRVTSSLTTWTHLNLRGSSEVFYALHFIHYALTRVAGKYHTNGKSVFLEYSSKDLHLSSKASNPLD